ncbi:PREDICTED: basic phospholipase A2 ammodytoxin B-like [Gavialis gangeticus]|uniref:basic phospholipase A2 ammodytoxin B-like n=1 Tax=Gavialis gangeticus TaxID=94835 RepID=UPI00092FA161|nr:PREDICTED: basic phospholipase A2 ammodytoxin B-like [Gavialis gangeticus]
MGDFVEQRGLFPLAAEFTIPLCSFEDVVLAYGNAIQFGIMIKATTGKNALFSYNKYGCFCGLGGKGTPVDATDRSVPQELLKIVMCLFLLVSAPNSCKREVCKCDRAAALCFKSTLRTYKKSYLFYPSKKCGRKKLTC